jgi:flagellar biosynthesis regulator FlaF
MQTALRASNAYRASIAHRTLKAQEAEVFRIASGGLRAARNASPTQQVRALADNRRLWTAVLDLVRDPGNGLPEGTKAGLASLAMAVEREMDRDDPDFEFLIEMNQQIADGLAGG